MADIQERLLPSFSPNLQLLAMDEELWLMAEERAQEILCLVQPNVVSEVNRKDIIEFVQRLIGGYYGGEVFVFGSVPLKTYLPDGDIDLTVLSHESVEDDLAQAVCNLLGSGEELEYEVKDVQHIRAQVGVVKCTVKNLAVDISFNQMAGLYALRFLEQVDQLVGKNHIFKRSIILVKAWCYYESRILGAHHGLLSTYAVEILVLYIINCFHSTVRGPLEVLYRFLDYYSTFDWEKNYVTVDGPQALSSLPEIVEKPESDRVGFLLSKELLKNYRDMCSVPKASEPFTLQFLPKHLNILDPLKNDNNLGRSVSRGNLHRIRFALAFGARKLKEILTLPGQNMGAALEMFFMNTLNRNGKGQRPDIDVPVPAFGTGRFEEPVLVGDCDSYYGGLQYVQLYRNYAMPPIGQLNSPSTLFDADMLALQQNWYMYYHRGTDLYVPRQPIFHPNPPQATYGLEEIGKSRGTGTYIPDMTHSTYWNVRARGTKPRRVGQVNNNNASPKSFEGKQVEEDPPVTDINDNNSKSFELLKEDFPLLPSVGNTESSASQESERDKNSSSDQLIIEFGTYSISRSMTEMSLGTKDRKEDSGVSFSQGATPVVSSLAVKGKEKSMQIEEKMD
ncbi:uncharacterized protein [Cicer arietinum]|uniref:Uncharacterized protein LOC101513710 n=1 Tax=Cicer arietinum TaxID=3827 RepID=A0A1S2YE02_CICAR|nr:uncharacterized protein LOC101513710 [Cicer arietinum]XP_012571878.1 uncharacterized protein LOC101513710 [Cicer arietinum]XP_012571879.1 uncharacterized protein LOC101513710 [Cicer arietinum]XP_012571880.1 uncharacterized protein LOC101513710 [Cicer arietinum]XP_027190331.1 uncharacterized protein LOC101513710 [Cicer arietinum]XP_027190332.1 uncharacterized protein LOC101513710 [Cicer arietinum]